nr:hypothetical protein [Streptomyces seoulensis]
MASVCCRGHPEEVVGGSAAPIGVHRPSAAGGRRVTARTRGYEEFLGTAYSDHDLIVFLESAGIDNPEGILDDAGWVEWRGANPHDWEA